MAVSEYFLFAGLSAVVISVIVWYIKRSRYRTLASKIPGPPGIPLLGNLLGMISNNEDIMGYGKKISEIHGPVSKLWLGPHLVVIITDPKDVSVIFNSSKTLNKSILYKPVRLFFGNSIFYCETNVWKKFRKIMEPAFAHQITMTYVSTFFNKSMLLADKLEKYSDGQPFDIVDYTLIYMLEMVTATILDVSTKGKEHQYFKLNLLKIANILAYMLVRPWYWFMCHFKFIKINKKLFEVTKCIRSFVDSAIKQKTESFKNSKKISVDYKINNSYDVSQKRRFGFLENMILTMANNPELFTEEDLKDQIIFVVSAAMDTTGHAVAHTLMLLGLHPDVQKRVLKEQEDIFGSDVNRQVTESDLKKMVYLEQVINETMRLYPPGPIVGRSVDEEVCITNYTIPAGASVVIPIFHVHRNPVYFPDPDKFDPDRFNKENCASRPACSFIPFSYGRKICMGKCYAYMVMKTMLSVVLRRYEILEHGSRCDMECFKFEFLLKLVNGYEIKIRPRNKTPE